MLTVLANYSINVEELKAIFNKLNRKIKLVIRIHAFRIVISESSNILLLNRFK